MAMKFFSGDIYEASAFPADSVFCSCEMTEANVQIFTSAGLRIPAHKITHLLPFKVLMTVSSTATSSTSQKETVANAMDELIELLRVDEPLWIKSLNNGALVFRRERYNKLFPKANHFTSAPLLESNHPKIHNRDFVDRRTLEEGDKIGLSWDAQCSKLYFSLRRKYWHQAAHVEHVPTIRQPLDLIAGIKIVQANSTGLRRIDVIEEFDYNEFSLKESVDIYHLLGLVHLYCYDCKCGNDCLKVSNTNSAVSSLTSVFSAGSDLRIRGPEAKFIDEALRYQIFSSLNCVPQENNILMLQENYIDPLEVLVVYAPIGLEAISAAINGEDTGITHVLLSGFIISGDGRSPDKLGSTTGASTSTSGGSSRQGSSLVTVAFQTLVNAQWTQMNMEAVATANTLISSNLQKIKAAFNCSENLE
ncbi:hypothetical protein LguiA_003469 [Lonicera macranthoides]